MYGRKKGVEYPPPDTLLVTRRLLNKEVSHRLLLKGIVSILAGDAVFGLGVDTILIEDFRGDPIINDTEKERLMQWVNQRLRCRLLPDGELIWI